jgi:transglutaminase-like putative cysteine protease
MLRSPVKRNIIFFILLFSCLMLLAEFLRHDAAHRAQPASGYPMQRQIQYSFTLQNQTNRLIEKAEFWAYGPVKQTATQRCDRLEVSHPYRLILDDLGNQILFFEVRNIAPFSSRIITIRAHMSFSVVPNPVPCPDLDRFLQPEPFYEADAPELTLVASGLRSGGVIESAEKIFQWVISNVKYSGYTRNDRGGLYALRKKEADCTEYMYLFAALCRADHIAARGMAGYVCAGSAVLRAKEFHNWVEFYDGKAWRIADPQRKMFMKDESHYVAMTIIGRSALNPLAGFHRFRYAGDGLKVRMNG